MLIEDIRRAEKDVMEVQERLLKATSDSEGRQIELEPRNIEYYSLLNPPAGGNNSKNEKERECRKYTVK